MDSYLLAVAAVALARGARRNVEHKVTSVIKVRLFCLLVYRDSNCPSSTDHWLPAATQWHILLEPRRPKNEQPLNYPTRIQA